MIVKRLALKTAIEFILVAGILVALMLVAVAIGGRQGSETNAVAAEEDTVVVIDAGHGGMDGGASGSDGTLEKHINLEIAEVLSELLTVSGYKTVMTRTDDVMLQTDDGKGSAKMQDLKQRLVISSKYPDSLTVSIHCNKFPMESCRGMQVYYSDSETAKKAAQSIQSASVLLQPYNKRAVKKADSAIYLLHRAKSPAVLVECGFLSNSEELSALKTEDYQKKLALVIFKGVTEQ